jgi:cysteine sulfinate desulfinase/cysteine desulfurase-like protein
LAAISDDETLALRFTFGKETTKDDLDFALEKLNLALEIQRKDNF